MSHASTFIHQYSRSSLKRLSSFVSSLLLFLVSEVGRRRVFLFASVCLYCCDTVDGRNPVKGGILNPTIYNWILYIPGVGSPEFFHYHWFCPFVQTNVYPISFWLKIYLQLCNQQQVCTWKVGVGRWRFLLGWPIFRGVLLVSGCVDNICPPAVGLGCSHLSMM